MDIVYWGGRGGRWGVVMNVVVGIVWVRLMWQGIFACESVTASFSIFAPFEIPQVTFESQLANFRVRGSPRQKFVAPQIRFKSLNLLEL